MNALSGPLFRLGAILLFTAWLCGCPEDTALLEGKVAIGFPLQEGAVRLLSGETPISASPLETDASGNWGPFAVWKSLSDLRVEVTGGILNDRPFMGVLSAAVPEEALQLDEDERLMHLAVTIPSTCVDRYRQFSGVDYETALADVAAFFELPDGVDLLAEELSDRYFDPLLFLERALAHSGFDAYLDSLVLRIGGEETEPMGADSANSVTVLQKGLASFASYQIFWGMVGKIAQRALPYVLSSAGIQESFEESVRNKLAGILAELKALRQEISRVNTRMQWAIDAIQEAQDSVLRQILISEMRPHLSILNTQFDQFLKIDFNNPASAVRFADNFKFDLDQELFDIHSIICDSPSENVLMYLSDYLSTQVHKAGGGEVALLKHYQVLEDYFSSVLAAEMKGLFLGMNLIDFAQRRGSEKAFPGSAADFAAKVTAKLPQQLDHFLLAVERLAVSAADVRSVSAGRYAMFPEEAVAQIFQRADFMARQFSPRHEWPLVIRLIGDIDLVMRSLNYAPIDARQFGAPEAMLIPEQGDIYRAYTPFFPDHYLKREYLTWRLGSAGEYSFNVRNKVAVAKLVFPHQTIPFTQAHRDNAPYARTYTLMPEYLQGTVRYTLRDAESGAESRAVRESDVFFGHGVFFARHRPQFVSIGRLGGSWSPDYDVSNASEPGSGLLKTYCHLKRNYSDDAVQHNAYETWITLNNASGRDQELQFDCNVTSTVNALGFENAAFPASPDTIHHLYLTLDWRLMIDEETALRTYGDTSGLAINYDRYLTRSLHKSTTQPWKRGASREVRHRAAKERISANSWALFRDRSDKDSIAIFEHQLNWFEIIPD